MADEQPPPAEQRREETEGTTKLPCPHCSTPGLLVYHAGVGQWPCKGVSPPQANQSPEKTCPRCRDLGKYPVPCPDNKPGCAVVHFRKCNHDAPTPSPLRRMTDAELDEITSVAVRLTGRLGVDVMHLLWEVRRTREREKKLREALEPLAALAEHYGDDPRLGIVVVTIGHEHVRLSGHDAHVAAAALAGGGDE